MAEPLFEFGTSHDEEGRPLILMDGKKICAVEDMQRLLNRYYERQRAQIPPASSKS